LLSDEGLSDKTLVRINIYQTRSNDPANAGAGIMLVTSIANGTFEPEELSLLQGLFDMLCELRGINRESPEATTAAESLIARYKAGLRGDELFSIGRAGVAAAPTLFRQSIGNH
ncbi:hypothetical protein, partial [Mesorhizobium sp. M7A.F.Ca.US.014.04.1.1]